MAASSALAFILLRVNTITFVYGGSQVKSQLYQRQGELQPVSHIYSLLAKFGNRSSGRLRLLSCFMPFRLVVCVPVDRTFPQKPFSCIYEGMPGRYFATAAEFDLKAVGSTPRGRKAPLLAPRTREKWGTHVFRACSTSGVIIISDHHCHPAMWMCCMPFTARSEAIRRRRPENSYPGRSAIQNPHFSRQERARSGAPVLSRCAGLQSLPDTSARHASGEKSSPIKL